MVITAILLQVVATDRWGWPPVVAYGVTGTQIAQAKKDYQRVLKGPIKTYAFLAAMDDALAARQKLLKSKTV